MSFAFPTPLGRIVLSLDENGHVVPVASEPLAAPAVAAWTLGRGRAVLSAIPLVSELPEELVVHRTTALVLRIGGRVATPSFTARISLEGDPKRGGPDNGQGLDAFTWTSEGTDLSLGTQDNEWLAHRAEYGLGVPGRLGESLRADSPIRQLPAGLEFRVPGLAADEELVLCFVVAWADATPANECATWFAVDLGHFAIAELMAQVPERDKELRSLIEQVRRMPGLDPMKPATAEEFAATERRLGISIPAALRELYLVMNGSERSTPVENGFLTFWPLDRWQTVGALGFPGVRTEAIVFADHSLDAWHLAFEAGYVDGNVRVHRIDGSSQVVGGSFAAFLHAVVHDDRPLYR